MRIASLVPSATEILFALELGDDVVAVTHECDYPPEAAGRARLTRSVIPEGLSAADIDAEVRRLSAEGRALYELDVELLESLDVDLIVTQQVCRVCAVDYEDVLSVAERLTSRPSVLSLDPSNLAEAVGDVARAGRAAGVPDRGMALRNGLERQIAEVRELVAGAEPPGVVALEWLDPPFTGGHWLPEMIAAAGGRELIGTAGTKSTEVDWDRITAAAPSRIVSMPCGWALARSRAETEAHLERIEATGAKRVDAVDAAASFSRPGPRLVDGIELLAHLFHPTLAPDPGTIPHARLL